MVGHEAKISLKIRNPYEYCTGCPYFRRKRLHWWEGFVVTVWARWTPSRWSWRGRGTPPPVAPFLWTWVTSSSTLCSLGRLEYIHYIISTVSVKCLKVGEGGLCVFNSCFIQLLVNQLFVYHWSLYHMLLCMKSYFLGNIWMKLNISVFSQIYMYMILHESIFF